MLPFAYICAKGRYTFLYIHKVGRLTFSYIYEVGKLTFLYFCEVGRLTFPSFANEDEGCFLLTRRSLHQSYYLNILRWVLDLHLCVMHPIVGPRLEPSGGLFLDLC